MDILAVISSVVVFLALAYFAWWVEDNYFDQEDS
jgi:nitrogen fixation-related uncharacterized protein